MKKTLIVTLEDSNGKFEIQNMGFNRLELIGALHLQMEIATREYTFVSKDPAPSQAPGPYSNKSHGKQK